MSAETLVFTGSPPSRGRHAECRHASSPLFFGRPGEGPRRFLSASSSKMPRARGTPRVRWTHGPRHLAISRLIEVRITASPPVPSASRARCFLGLLRSAPGGLTFQQPFSPFGLSGRLTTASGRDPASNACDRLPAGRHGAQWRTAGAPGPKAASAAAGGGTSRHPIPRPPPPIPAS